MKGKIEKHRNITYLGIIATLGLYETSLNMPFINLWGLKFKDRLKNLTNCLEYMSWNDCI